MSGGQTTFTQFGPDAPLSSLNTDFQACLLTGGMPRSLQDQQRCDTIVGSLASGIGYCHEEPFSRMTYCACVNNAIPCPMVAAAACANSAFAYRPATMLAPDGAAYKDCKDETICVNVVEVGGSQNVVSGITQQCGVIQNIRNVLGANPALAILAFILLIALVVLAFMRPEDSRPGFLPPPPPGVMLY